MYDGEIEPGTSIENSLPDILTGNSQDGCVRNLLVEIGDSLKEHIGFILTRTTWDPYPWVKAVEADSPAGRAGLLEGDCLLAVGSHDLIGLKVSDTARLLRACPSSVNLRVWTCSPSNQWDPEALFCGPLPGALRRMTACLSGVLRAAECPVCGCSVPPPALQCARGHLLCARCRPRLPACPLCRAPQAPIRNLLADELYNCVVESFELRPGPGGAHLSRSLLGDKARFTTRERETGLYPEHDPPRRTKHKGTQRLLERLLPGRARSTGNLSSPAVSDLTRSLSTLDVARRGPNSLNGSCDSLPAGIFREETNEESTPLSGVHCPVSLDCEEIIAKEDLFAHALGVHGQSVYLQPGGTVSMDMEPSNSNPGTRGLRLGGSWFYPKSERDDSGVRIWCWSDANELVCSKYQVSVEVWPVDLARNVVYNKSNGLNSLNHSVVPEIRLQGESLNAACKSLNDDIPEIRFPEENATGPLLSHAGPVLSLQRVSWRRVMSTGKSLFLSNRLIMGSEIKMIISPVDRAQED